MDQTFAETMGFAPFDWSKALDDAIKKEPDGKTSERLFAKAGLWTTCACGSTCAIIPRRGYGELYESAPVDDVLFDLGMEFYGNIGSGRWLNAKSTLAKIEERSEELIKIELAKLNK